MSTMACHVHQQPAAGITRCLCCATLPPLLKPRCTVSSIAHVPLLPICACVITGGGGGQVCTHDAGMWGGAGPCIAPVRNTPAS
jgi:hypothetical protein